jgi:hypothetical protein
MFECRAYHLAGAITDVRALHIVTTVGGAVMQARKYKRYKLADHKDFNSLFFKEKANLLKMLHNFENKSGKCVCIGSTA